MRKEDTFFVFGIGQHLTEPLSEKLIYGLAGCGDNGRDTIEIGSSKSLRCLISNHYLNQWDISGLILGLCPVNERGRYKVTPSLIGWAQTKNQPSIWSTPVAYLYFTKDVQSSLDETPFEFQWQFS